MREGSSFRNAFVTNSLCLPSRASILTGMYSHACGCPDNKNRQIPEAMLTVADLLRAAGYDVAFFGKSHIKDLSHRYWDAYFGIEAAVTNYYRPVIIESEKGIAKPPATFQGYADGCIITDRAMTWLDARQERPFCLFLWFMSPHGPFYRPRRFMDLYNGVPIPKPRTFDDDLKGYPGKPQVFKDCNNKIGTPIKGIDNPRTLEETSRTITPASWPMTIAPAALWSGWSTRVNWTTRILLSSDHGFYLGEWRCFNKMFMHEPSIRVPWRWLSSPIRREQFRT